jgi:uncharacterized membrane protein YeaQ/YmgE (transglycosylase-associated protein family)
MRRRRQPPLRSPRRSAVSGCWSGRSGARYSAVSDVSDPTRRESAVTPRCSRKATLRNVFGAILSAVVSGFLIGAAARLALPGPDPMPFSLTVVIGLAGSLAGGGIAAGIFGTSRTLDTSGHAFATLLLEVGVAIALVAAYRRFVQKRPLWGPEAHRFPTRGVGVARMRTRLRRLGVDPDRLGGRGGAQTPVDPQTAAEKLEKLRDLRDQGVLSEEDYEKEREQLRRY